MKAGRNAIIAASLLAGVPIAASAPVPAQQQEVRATLTGESGRLPRLAISPFLIAGNEPPQDTAKTIAEVLWKDLEFERAYDMVDPSVASAIAPAPVESLPYESWAATGADDVRVASLQQNGANLQLDVRVMSLATRKSVFARRYTCPGQNHRLCAHTISDEVHKVRFGVDGVARTKLAFTSDRDATEDGVSDNRTSVKEIYITDYDGAYASRMTTKGSLNLGPAWSPDGRSFAYQSYQLGFADIFVQRLYDAKASLLRPAQGTEHQQNYLPAWSPDGRRIAYVSSRDGDWEIYVMKVDGSDRRRLTANPADDGAPAWSPNGSQIAFTSDRDGTNQIYIMSAEGGPAEQLTHSPMGVDRPTWSRSNVIAYTVKTVDGTEIQTINLETRQVVSLTDGPGTSESPSFAPNGRHIAFVTTRWGQQHVAIMDVDGRNVRQITFAGNNRFPTWSAGPLEK